MEKATNYAKSDPNENFTHTLYIKAFEAEKSFVDLIDDYLIAKIFLLRYLCITHAIRWERIHYKRFSTNIP